MSAPLADTARAEQRALRRRDPAEWRRRYVTGLDGACAACAAGQPIIDRYVSAFGAACHVHRAPAWKLAPTPPMGRGALL